MHAHPSAMPGMNASPMPSMPRGALQNGVGLHPMGSPLTPGFRGPPGNTSALSIIYAMMKSH